MANRDIEGFTRDKEAGSRLAASFGQGVGNAEQLIEANALRHSAELEAASRLDRDPEASDEVDAKKVASELGVPEDGILATSVRGDYVVAVFRTPDGRAHKEVLDYSEGKPAAFEREEDPRRARLRASLEAQAKIAEAEREAEKIVAEARAEAARVAGEATQKAQEAEADALEKAEKAAAKRDQEAQRQQEKPDKK